ARWARILSMAVKMTISSRARKVLIIFLAVRERMFFKDSDSLLADFTDLRAKKDEAKSAKVTKPAEQYEQIPYPFQHQMEKWRMRK
ncbi:MAG: hypothetical protein Q8R88_09900, partial [Desulfoprunum sp.]|nr:hypothetical protein [Desulfoprunum sp.]